MADAGGTEVYDIRVEGTDLVVACRRDEKVLIALEQAVPFPHEKAVRVGCRQGGCGACRVRVLSGSFEAAKMSRAHVTVEEQADGYALACKISPTSDLVIEPAFVSPKERMAMRQAEQRASA